MRSSTADHRISSGHHAGFAFLYPMKFVRPDKRADVRAGLIMVPIFVIPVVTMWYTVKRYIDADAAKSEAEEADGET